MTRKTSDKLKVIGIMNGTSIDGADFVLVEVSKKDLTCRHLKTQSFNFPKDLRLNLIKAAQHKMLVDELALLHHELGRYYANCFKKLKSEFKKATLIGLHGQTVFHKGQIATLQIGEPSYLAEVSKATVVSDFRAADLALGGHGAPIATFFHQINFGRKGKTISVHNLGGISNLSLIQNGKLKFGFDTGPANMLMDMAVRVHTAGQENFDRNGSLAKKGKSDSALVKQMMKHRYFSKKPPKSCGREEFGEVFYAQYQQELHAMSIEDRLATVADLVAKSIAVAYQKFCPVMPEEIVFAGGGAKNKFLLQKISEYLPQVKISTTEDYNWPLQSIEGAAFACLAAAKYWGKPSNIPQSTGAKRATSLGKVTQV